MFSLRHTKGLQKMNDLKEKREEKKQEKSKEKTTTTARACAREHWVGLSEIATWPYFNLTYLKNHFSVESLNRCADKVGLNRSQRIAWLKYIDSVGWCYPTGRKITELNCQRSMRMWRVVDERLAAEKGRGRGSANGAGAKENEYERIKRLEALRRVEMAAKPESWELCGERCAMFLRGKCSKGRKIPPQLRERPVAPEECPQFKGKEVR